MTDLSVIKHIVVLMLENRSFDNMLGRLNPPSATFDGLSLTASNLDTDGTPIAVWNQPGTDKIAMTIPCPDPGELFTDMNSQLFGAPEPPTAGARPTMGGFVKSYRAQDGNPPGKPVMHFFTPEQVPVISALARQFAVSDRWHAAAPCQTWPNRFFVHTATAGGWEDNRPTHFPYEMPTIFDRFESVGAKAAIPGGWKIYFHDMPQSLTLSRLWPYADRFRLYEEFGHDARAGTLPAYSFIEPRYFADLALPNDAHPPHVVTLGEQLIADVYNSVRAGPGWTETLLIITYDEHGGCYDHVPPPAAIPPSAPAVGQLFAFDRYGVRVPAVLVSPFIRPGTVLRPSPDARFPFDHTSIIATLRKRFPELGESLTDRDAAAPDLAAVLDLATPDNLGPERLQALPYVVSPADVAAAQNHPLNDMQQALVRLAAHLPATAAPAGTGFLSFIEAHLAALRVPGAPRPGDVTQPMADAVKFVKDRLGVLFRSLG